MPPARCPQRAGTWPTAATHRKLALATPACPGRCIHLVALGRLQCEAVRVFLPSKRFETLGCSAQARLVQGGMVARFTHVHAVASLGGEALPQRSMRHNACHREYSRCNDPAQAVRALTGAAFFMMFSVYSVAPGATTHGSSDQPASALSNRADGISRH